MFQDTIAEFMDFQPVLKPLQYLAALRMAILVSESEDVQYMIGGFPKTNDYYSNVGLLDDQWRQVRLTVIRKLNQIDVPDKIIDIVLENLWPVFFEIYTWVFYHDRLLGIVSSSNFCWTPEIKIDYDETAKALVENEALDIKHRFRLACIYCLDNEVRSLFDQMSLSERRSFFVRGNLKKSTQNPIVLYWTYYIQEVPVDYWNSRALNHSWLFFYAVEKGYLSATKFFFSKLNVQLRVRMISRCFHRFGHLYNPVCIVKDHLAIACFLMCQIPSNLYEMRYFLGTGYIFLYFLERPFQKHFIAVYKRLRRNFKGRIFVDLLDLLLAIMGKEVGGFKDYNYKELFKELWSLCPVECKNSVNASKFGYKMFMKFVKKQFGFVFEENAFAAKARFRAVLFRQEIPADETHFETDNVEFLKFLVRERITTRSSIDRFSQQRYFNRIYRIEVNEFFNLPLGELMYLIDGILEGI